jgi:hypothetical protein
MRKLLLLCLIGLFALPNIYAQDTERDIWQAAGIAFDYPADWVVRDDLFRYGAISIASDSSALDGDDIPEGEFLIQINAPLSKADASAQRFGVTTLTPEAALSVFSGRTTRPIEPFEIDGAPAARADLEADGLQITFIAIDLDSVIAVVFATARIDSFAPYDDTLTAFVASLKLVEPSIANGTFTALDVPAEYPDVDGLIWHNAGAFAESDFSTMRGAFGRLTVVDDQIYVATGGDSLLIFAADGTLTGRITNPGIVFQDVAVDADGNFWVIDAVNMKVIHMDAEGRILNAFGRFGQGVDLFPLLAPADIVVGVDGRLYIINTTTSGEQTFDDVQVWEPDGTFVTAFNAATRTGGTSDTVMMVPGLDDDLVTTWGGSALVSIYNPDGTSVGVLNAPVEGYRPSSIAVDDEGLILFEYQGQIFRLGREIVTFGILFEDSQGAIPPGRLFYPRGLGVLSNGDVVVADANETHWHIMTFAAVPNN